jgi:hypothetical protein
VCRDGPRILNELKTAITAFIRNISQADLQKVFPNEIKRVQVCIDARVHQFQHLSYVYSDFPKALCIDITWEEFLPHLQGIKDNRAKSDIGIQGMGEHEPTLRASR